MGPATPTVEPTRIVQGTTASWLRPYGDTYPADGWQLVYAIRGGNPQTVLTVTTTDSPTNSSWLATIPASTTAGWEPGNYLWQLTATKDATVLLLDSGVITVDRNFATQHAVDVDTRSPARKLLDYLNQTLSNAAYLKTLQPQELSDLIMRRKYVEWDVKREEDAEKVKRGEGARRKIYTRFARIT